MTKNEIKKYAERIGVEAKYSGKKGKFFFKKVVTGNKVMVNNAINARTLKKQ